MAMNFTFIKKHPYGSGAAVLIGGFVLYMLLSAGSSSATATGGQYSDPNGAAVQQQNAAAAMAQEQHAAEFAQMQLAAITEQNIATIKANEDITLGTQVNNNQAQQIALAAAVQNKSIDAQLQESTQQVAAALQASTIASNNQTQVQMAGIAATRQMQEDQLQASVDNTNTLANLQLNLSATNAALQQNLVNINAQATVAQAQINSDTQLGMAKINADVSMHNSNNQKHSSDTSSWLGAAVGIASMFFCDVNLKCNITCVSTASCLAAIRAVPLVKFQYIAGTEPYNAGDVDTHVNTLSQDFYKALGVAEYNDRKHIDLIDMMGAMLGAIKELDKNNG